MVQDITKDNNMLAFNEVVTSKLMKNINYYNSKRTCLYRAFWISGNVYKLVVKQAVSDKKRSSGERQFSKN